MRRRITILFLIAVCFSIAQPVSAEDAPITVIMNGQSLTLEPQPFIKEGSVFVPMRAIFEALGADIVWIPETRTVQSARGDINLSYTIGDRFANKNGATVALDAPGRIVNGATMVPVRFMTEVYGAKVRWDESARRVDIQYANKQQVQIREILHGFYINVHYSDTAGNPVLETVRLAGISPIHNGVEATKLIQSFIPNGSEAWMEIRGARDRNQHLHALIYLSDGSLFNERLVEEGYAKRSNVINVEALDDRFISLEATARSAKKGLWSSAEPKRQPKIIKMSMNSTNAAVITEDQALWNWGQFYEKPTKILDHVIDVKVGSDAGVALKSDGTVWVWGMNQAALWGNGRQAYATTVVPGQVEGLQAIVAVEMAHSAIMAVDRHGQVFAWGSNYNGKLGRAYQLSAIVYTEPYLTSWTDVAGVSPGFMFTAILKKDGTVWQTQPDSDELIRLETLRNVVAISNQNTFALALRDDGTVWTWGVPSYFGPGNPDNPVPKQVEGLAHITQIRAGHTHALAVDKDGQLFAWGDNSYGELGDAGLGTYVGQPALVEHLSPAVLAEAGRRQSLFLLENGALWGAGESPHYMLGDHPKKSRYEGNVHYHDLNEISLTE